MDSAVEKSGRGAVWLARLLWEQEVGGSNPLAPTILKKRKFRYSGGGARASNGIVKLTHRIYKDGSGFFRKLD